MKEEYAVTSPASLCVLYLEQAAHEAEKAIDDAQRWFFAIPEMSRALNCALVAVMSGSGGFGAYSLKARKEWVDYFDLPDWPDHPEPTSMRVQSARELFERVLDFREPELLGRPVVIDANQMQDLNLLIQFRDDMEHVKPRGWSIQTAGLPRLLNSASMVVLQLIDSRTHFLLIEDDEINRAHEAIMKIRSIFDLYPSSPEKNI